MIDPTEFGCVDELDGINEDFFLAFSDGPDAAGESVDGAASDPDLWDDVPY